MAAFAVARCDVAMSRPFWFDEIITYHIAADESLGHSLAALADGVDFNPPAIHLLSRAALSVSPFSPETTLRLLSVLAMWGALVGLYLVLRPAFSPLVVVTVVLATEASALVVVQMFEARFYATWSAAIVWFCYFLQRASRGQAAWPLVGLAISSLLVCTIHYFGIVSVVLVCGSHFLVQWSHVKHRCRLWAAVLSGPLALAACTPLYLGQPSRNLPSQTRSSLRLCELCAFKFSELPEEFEAQSALRRGEDKIRLGRCRDSLGGEYGLAKLWQNQELPAFAA